MCGIAGFTHSGPKSAPELIQKVTATIQHRGPDQLATWSGQLASLGAVRLRVIDPDGGDQPFQTEDSRLTLVFNGEIYNHAALREELQARGHRFRSRCDTEVVLRAFDEWGIASFQRLRGMFAAAIWDAAGERLYLVRDRLGIKPLYYSERQGEVRFGSELKAILEHPDQPRVLDHRALSFYLSLNYVPTPYTLIEGIRKVTPGCWLEWHRGRVEEHRYWQLPAPAPQARSIGAAKEELDHLLRSSIQEHLVADVPLGLWASGGVDSSTILHYASELSSQQLKTFSVAFHGRSFDESPYFREVQRRYNTEHHEIDLSSPTDLADVVENLTFYSDEPSADAGALPVYYLSRLSRQHVTVALSGEGADELFAGYQTYLADSYARLARRSPAWLRRLGLQMLRLWPASNDKIGLDYKAQRFLSGSLLDPFQSHLYWNGTFSRDEVRRLCPGLTHPCLSEIEARLPAPGLLCPLSRFLYLDQHYYLTDDILYKADRMSMAHSLEVRPPFLDHRIVEWGATLPPNLKMQGSTLKRVLRQLMADKLPSSVLNRRKEGLDIPAHDWFRGALRPLLHDTITERTVRETGLFTWPMVQQIMTAHQDRRANLGYHLWGLVTLLQWMKRWQVQVQAEPAVETVETAVRLAAAS